MSSSSQKPFRILGLAYVAVVSIGALCAIIYGIVRIANGDDFIAYKMFDHNPGEASMGPNRSYFYVMLFSSPLLQGIVWLASSIFLAVGILKHNIVFVRGYRVHFVVISAVALTLFIVIHVYNLVHRKYPVSILFLVVGSCVMIVFFVLIMWILNGVIRYIESEHKFSNWILDTNHIVYQVA
ncbi:uncharacterized protein LOC119769754 [Culex quinquefasciatus]|uniref:uncharacterized protein LOC119769754 n=1 Tax=Culex quinquefasciatus TaxID=7176 RepID=UPI0018E3A692|nr:uncharacterized protein LOC119769754 [Culex quinquefasciatus]